MPSQTTPFESLLEAVPDALVVVDPAGVIRFVNRQTELLFGYDRDDMVGQPIEMLVPQSLREAHRAQREGYVAAPRTRLMGSDLNLRGRNRDGAEFPVDISLSSTDTGDGRLVIAAVRDMTGHRKIEEDRRRLDRLAAIIEFSAQAIISTGPDGNITSWNPAASRMFGYSNEEIIGKSVMLLTPQSRTEETIALMAGIREGRSAVDLETLAVRKDGTTFPVSLTISPIRDADGAIIGASTIARDVTEQRQAFEAAQRMAAIVEHSDDAIIGRTLDGIITTWNPAAERMFGYSSAEIIGRSIDLIVPEDRAGEILAVMAKIIAGEPVEHLETVRVRKDGTVFPVSLTVSPIHYNGGGTIIGVSTIARDVTEATEAFEAARSMIESSLDSLVAISPEGRITDVNEATVTVTGIPREELIGTAFSDCFTDPEKANAIYQLAFEQGMAVDYPLTMRHRDGRLTEVLYNASVYRDAGGRVLGVFAAARDVTRQRQDQRRIADQQATALERLAELERFQRLTVGRELKMIELKKEIESLRKHLPTDGGEPGDQP